ncbi:putative NADH dehydrogenase/NAD(P)H nitroreductase [[Clostridium] ultunense Esp]|uniref:Putative NADH dehydrogenase/NAD(P)H nitroreductase n=1 Tax=[Clostridium] ultunense Esp TaxID=1288971 RepID=M1Z440_9FIRM|nr:nitroreductase family protein [Schnuerera ultunensis]CCQ92806.1 putative NADH dehydrogenase/NAD(P)H nitroreductase [[Clostridium] ultunense Esp]SHD75819.1 putative NADH dehydrogenase/NAD(P)H nitroreductase [[Clostridium] ultunense Esp]
MNVLEAIMTRRSIRKFTGEPISEEDLKTILKAGFQAPSAHNFQPREYVVVRDQEKIQKITEFHKYAKMLPKAGCGIIVCGDREKQPEIGFLVEDCSASIQNMLLAAHGLGLGAVWCGLYSVEKLTKAMAEVLELPEHIIPIGMVVVGVKDEEKDSVDRYDESKIHYDRWK